MRWTTRRKAEIEQQIRDAEAAREEARQALERTHTAEERASVWDTVVARRAVDGIGMELEIAFTRRQK